MDNEYDDYYFFSKSPIVLLVASLVFQILLVLGLVLSRCFAFGDFDISQMFEIYDELNSVVWVFIFMTVYEFFLLKKYVNRVKTGTFRLINTRMYVIFIAVHQIVIGLSMIEGMGSIGEGLFEMLPSLITYCITGPVLLAILLVIGYLIKKQPNYRKNETVNLYRASRKLASILVVFVFAVMGICILLSDYISEAFDFYFLYSTKNEIEVYQIEKTVWYLINFVFLLKYLCMGHGVALAMKYAKNNEPTFLAQIGNDTPIYNNNKPKEEEYNG